MSLKILGVITEEKTMGIFNKRNGRWKEDIIVLQTCIIKDNNKDVDILDFLKIILKINKEEKEDKNDQ